MKIYFYVVMMFVIATVTLNAQTFEVTGNDSLTQVSIGDTVMLSVEEDDINIQIESSTRLLIRAGTLLSFDGGEKSLDIILDDGQLFIDRQGRERELDTLRVLSQGFIFVPTGTAFGVKATPQGAPTLAVLRGTAQMQNANDDSSAVEVGVGQFATVNSNGVIVSGDLSNRGVAQLEAWSGVKLTTEEEIEEEEIEEEETTVTVYIEVDDEEDETRPLTKRELREMRREERRLEKIARREERRVAKEMRRQEKRAAKEARRNRNRE